MDTDRFKAVTRALASRRSRRSAVAGGGAELAALALGPAAVRDARQTAPGANEDRTYFLYLQTFENGRIVPKPDEDGVYELTLEHGHDQTVYFSDRPERIVGTVPTGRFLDALGFTPANPPNAALVAQTSEGEDILVVELFDPRYAVGVGPTGEAIGTLTYDVRILADYAGDGLAHLAAQQVDRDFTESFGPASLFIDDCPDHDVRCVDVRSNVMGDLGPQGTCWRWCDLKCYWCRDTGSFIRQCNATFPACNGRCGAEWDGDTENAPFSPCL